MIKLALILSLTNWDVAYKANVYTDYGKLRLTVLDTERNDKLEVRYSIAGFYQDKLTFNLGD